MGTGGDVEEDQFVGPLVVVPNCQFHRVAHGPQATVLGASELNPSGDTSIVNVQTRNDAACEHDEENGLKLDDKLRSGEETIGVE